MFEKIINELAKAQTTDEIISYKSQILKLYTEIYSEICSKGCCITNYHDIETLYNLNSPMAAYYGTRFYEECGIPFLKKHNSMTINILNFIVLFYSLQIINLLENGFFNKVSKCIYKHPEDMVFEHTEKINLTDNKQNLFAVLWSYFVCVITIGDDTREFIMEYDGKQEIFYLTDEKYEIVIDTIYKSLDGNDYFNIIDKILGKYKTRFTKMQYIATHQPLFVDVGYKYLCSLIM